MAVNGDFIGPGRALIAPGLSRGKLITTMGIPQWQLTFDAAGGATVHDAL